MDQGVLGHLSFQLTPREESKRELHLIPTSCCTLMIGAEKYLGKVNNIWSSVWGLCFRLVGEGTGSSLTSPNFADNNHLGCLLNMRIIGAVYLCGLFFFFFLNKRSKPFLSSGKFEKQFIYCAKNSL